MAAALGRERALGKALREALEARVSPARLDEALLQLVPFAGFGRAINAFRVLRRQVPAPSPSRARTGSRRRRGEALCRRIYGTEYGRMISRMRSFHPDLARWILEDGYGRVLARPVLTPRERELLVLPVLAALKLGRQLEAHVRGARRVGATPSEIRAVLRATRGAIPSGRRPRPSRSSASSSNSTPRSRTRPG